MIDDIVTNEQEIRDGMRGYAKAQELLAEGRAPSRLTTFGFTTVGWYGTDTDTREGYFGYINRGSTHEDLVGDVVEIQYNDRSILVYLLGVEDLVSEVHLSRAAFVRIAPLASEEINATAVVWE